MRIFVVFKKQRVLTVPRGTIKNRKIMAATNYTIVRRNKTTNTILLDELTNKWTYKQALAIAKESATDASELVCVIESNKIMSKNEKEDEKNCAL